ncbi:MAG: hypothetical protein M3Y62_08330 [Candidatus Dormibacteraeota bacterium]|nr:hypothetical protein [Candidatus Dormibacteraeota bacterium]
MSTPAFADGDAQIGARGEAATIPPAVTSLQLPKPDRRSQRTQSSYLPALAWST